MSGAGWLCGWDRWHCCVSKAVYAGAIFYLLRLGRVLFGRPNHV